MHRARLPLAGLLTLAGCSVLFRAAGYPPEVTRREAPAGIESRALAAGDPAVNIELPASDSRTHALRDEWKEGPVVLLFFRGRW